MRDKLNTAEAALGCPYTYNREDNIMIREYKTPNFRVTVTAEPEDDIDLSWDDTGATAAGLASGEFISFRVVARAYRGGELLAEDHLGQCIYRSTEDFRRNSGYFCDMVRNVCRGGREAMRAARDLYLRG